jgi:hypothetical protein
VAPPANSEWGGGGGQGCRGQIPECFNSIHYQRGGQDVPPTGGDPRHRHHANLVRHPFSISMFELVWIIRKNIKPHGPTRQPHSSNNGAAVPTSFRPRPPPCPPTALSATPTSRPTHRFRHPQPPPRVAFKRSAPSRELPFSSSTHCHHCAIVEPM